jgi:two-component system, sensor histidine kinase and response regulator
MHTILLIDDDIGIRTAYGMALEHHGYRVLEAESGYDGLAMAQKHLPDLIITDINMPGGNGESLLKHIRQSPDLRDKQVVMITGQPDMMSPRRGMEAGADDFLLKPVGLDELLRCVEARLKRAEVNWRIEDKVLAQLRMSLPSNLPTQFFTPIAGILGLAGIVRTQANTFSHDEIGEIMDDIYNTANKLHRSIRNYLMILDLQHQSEEEAPSPKILSQNEATESVKSGIKAAARKTGREQDVKLHIENSSLSVNAADLAIIVEELIDNSCSYSRSRSEILVNLSDEGILSISDSGRGMTREQIRQVCAMEPWSPQQSECSELGLGLTLVAKLCRKWKAPLSIKTGPTEGTRIDIAFRQKTAQPKESLLAAA